MRVFSFYAFHFGLLLSKLEYTTVLQRIVANHEFNSLVIDKLIEILNDVIVRYESHAVA